MNEPFSWEPNQYEKFIELRTRPALDLLRRIVLDNPHCIYDLGCGTGKITRLLADRWPGARVIGIDRSIDMLRKAREATSNVEWLEADISTWGANEAVDLIFSNAVLHWVPHHEELFPRFAKQLHKSGVLAVQMPVNWASPSHQIMREIFLQMEQAGGMARAALRAKLERPPVANASDYYEILAPVTESVDIWITEYEHALKGTDPVVEWMKGTGLRPVLASLSEAERESFLSDYAARIARAYPARRDGTTLFPFRRLFIVAIR